MSPDRTATALEPSLADDDYGLPGEPPWTEIDWHGHIRDADIDGSRVRYVDLGTGPALVMIHGLSGCWQNWLENIPFFAERHRVIAVDLPGFGASELPDEPVSIQAYGAFVDKLLTHLGIERATFLGNSMGGFVTAEVALRFPTCVEKMVLVSAAGAVELPHRASADQMLRGAVILRPLTEAMLKRAGFLARRPRGRRLMLGMVCRYPERLSPAMSLEMIAGANKPGFAHALRSTLTYDFRHRLSEVEAEALVVWGRNDMVVPVRCADIYERLLPNSRKVILERTAHVPMIERARTFNSLVEDFLAA